MEGEVEMQNQMNGLADPHHVITVATNASQAANDLSSQRPQWFSPRPPTRLQPWAGRASCSIFRVPICLFDSNPKAYKPQIASIGPYHHGQEPFWMIEEHKPRYFENLVKRTRRHNVSYNDYRDALSLKEADIRDCYSQDLPYESSDLIKMMVLDGCFIIEVFRMLAGVIKPMEDDPLFKMRWVFSFLTQDFLQLENQIPFFVLETLYDLSRPPPPEEPQRPLIQLALEFFNWTIQRSELDNLAANNSIFSTVKHLLHLLQLTFTNSLGEPDNGDTGDIKLHLIQSANKLHQAGIKFKKAKSGKKLLDIQFNQGVLLIPPLAMDDFFANFFLNCIVFEQCYCHTKDHITTYVKFMGLLMRTETDLSFLSDCQVLENYCGSDAEVATRFNEIVKDIGFDVNHCYLAGVFQEVDRYYKNKWLVRWWTGIKRKYFGAPWSPCSLLAAFIVLALAFIQATMALYTYFHPKK